MGGHVCCRHEQRAGPAGMSFRRSLQMWRGAAAAVAPILHSQGLLSLSRQHAAHPRAAQPARRPPGALLPGSLLAAEVRGAHRGQGGQATSPATAHPHCRHLPPLRCPPAGTRRCRSPAGG